MALRREAPSASAAGRRLACDRTASGQGEPLFLTIVVATIFGVALVLFVVAMGVAVWKVWGVVLARGSG